MSYIFIYITNPNKITAKKIAKALLQEKLIACANIFPINSLYLDKGGIKESDEYAMICKSHNSHFKAIEGILDKIHPYDVPCIAKFAIDPGQKYQEWLSSELKKP